MTQRHILFATLAVMLMLVSTVIPAVAQVSNIASSSGRPMLDALQGAITGNIGFFIGLAITILGLWTWIVKQETGAGVVMIIGGVLITLVPGIFNGARELASGIVQQIGGVNSVSVNPGFSTGSAY
ncbi:MAG: hypothetical protein EBR79_03000 [Proteobacteria bacterium]|nr:hypothetical protein [Pseudomonadota bacterium]NBX85715.1 hypothetical protein [Pseudomonadota bacterium]